MPSIWQDLYKVFQPKPLQFCLPTNRFTYDTKKSTAPERLAGKQAQGTCGTQRFATLNWGWTLGPVIRWTGQCYQQQQGQNLCSHGNWEQNFWNADGHWSILQCPAPQLLACWCWNPENNAKTCYLLQVQTKSVGHRHSTCAKPTKQRWVYWRMCCGSWCIYTTPRGWSVHKMNLVVVQHQDTSHSDR